MVPDDESKDDGDDDNNKDEDDDNNGTEEEEAEEANDEGEMSCASSPIQNTLKSMTTRALKEVSEKMRAVLAASGEANSSKVPVSWMVYVSDSA